MRLRAAVGTGLPAMSMGIYTSPRQSQTASRQERIHRTAAKGRTAAQTVPHEMAVQATGMAGKRLSFIEIQMQAFEFLPG